MDSNKNFRGLALEGGGVSALAHIGVIEELHNREILSNLTHISGSSAGSIIATLIACRLSYEQIREAALSIDYAALKDSAWYLVNDIYRLINRYGWNSGRILSEVFGNVLEKYINNRSITFGQIRDNYGTTLIITSTDVTSGTTVYYTPDSNSDMCVIDAIRESSGIPLFYSPVIKGEHMYVDGCLLNSYPIEKLYDYLPKEQVFGVKLIPDSPQSIDKIPVNIIEYATKLIKLICYQASKVHIDEDDWKRTIKVNIGTICTTDFYLTDEQKFWLIEQGQIAAKKFFE